MVSVAFTGDIAFSKYFAEAYKTNFIDREISDFLNGADHVVANVEAPITAGTIQSDRALNHTMPPQVVDTLLAVNACIWSLANNHVMDAKEQGLKDTLAVAAENGCVTVGAGMNAGEADRPVYLEGAGGIGIFSAVYHRPFLASDENTPGALTTNDVERIRANIQEIKKKCRWCVMIAHAGAEFSQLPLPYVRRMYKSYLDMGADVVIGHHPHVVQNYETFGDKVIFYSLGNFIFDTDYQRNQRYTQFGMLVKLKFEENAFTWENCPVLIDRESTRIRKGEAPAVFRDIRPGQYRVLQPIMLRDYLRNNRSAAIFSKPSNAERTYKQWFDVSRKRHGFWGTVEFRLGRALSYLGLWRLSSLKDVKQYIWPKEK